MGLIRSGVRSLSFPEVRGLLRAQRFRRVAALFWIAFIVIASYAGLFLFWGGNGNTIDLSIIPWNGQVIWWDFPIFQLLTPWFQLAIPFLSALEIAVTGVFAAWGAALAIVIWSRTAQGRLKESRRVVLGMLSGMGILAFSSPLIAEGVTSYLALSGAPGGWEVYGYSWYLPVLSLVADLVILIFWERWLEGIGRRGKEVRSRPVGPSQPTPTVGPPNLPGEPERPSAGNERAPT